MNKWEPIETAPNDEAILVARYNPTNGKSYVELISAADNDFQWGAPDDLTRKFDHATHWMLPPTPPVRP